MYRNRKRTISCCSFTVVISWANIDNFSSEKEKNKKQDAITVDVRGQIKKKKERKWDNLIWDLCSCLPTDSPWKGEADVFLLQWVYFLSVPPPQRRQRARSLPVPRGSMHTGGFLSRLALSGATGQTPWESRPTARKINKQRKREREKKENERHQTILLLHSYYKPLQGRWALSISGGALHLTVITFLCFDW